MDINVRVLDAKFNYVDTRGTSSWGPQDDIEREKEIVSGSDFKLRSTFDVSLKKRPR